MEQQRGTAYQQVVYGPGGGKLALMNAQTLNSTQAFRLCGAPGSANKPMQTRDSLPPSRMSTTLLCSQERPNSATIGPILNFMTWAKVECSSPRNLTAINRNHDWE